MLCKECREVMNEFTSCYVCPKCKIVKTRKDVMIEEILQYFKGKDKEKARETIMKLVAPIQYVFMKEQRKTLDR